MLWGILQDHTGQQHTGRANWGQATIADIAGLQHRFRIYSVDNTLMFEGRSSQFDTLDAYEPLDWAALRGQAAEIHYEQDDGSWEAL